MDNFLFDLDGTLTDPSLGITKSVAYALRSYGIETEDLSSLNKFIGPPLTDSFKRYYGFSDEEAVKAMWKYREYFSEKGLFENTLYPHVEEMLSSLKEKGKKLLIATSKPEIYTIEILKHFGIYKYFDFVAGNTLEEERATKEAVIAYAIESSGIDPKNSVMIGDRKFDILAGKSFGMKTVGAEFGFPEENELTKAGADYIAKTYEEMKNIVLSL